MNGNMDILKTMLHTWSDEEISEAWSMIAQEGKRRKNLKTKNIKSTLSSGDEVTFVGRKLGQVTGTIVRVKTKKAIVRVGSQNWDVPISMLNKV